MRRKLKDKEFAKRYLTLLVDKIEVDGVQATLQGSYRKLTHIIVETKMGTSDEVPILCRTGSPAATPADCLFNWAEQTFPQYFSPAGTASNTYEQYYFRAYADTGNYLATAADGVWVLGRSFGGAPLQVGALSAYLGQAGCAP